MAPNRRLILASLFRFLVAFSCAVGLPHAGWTQTAPASPVGNHLAGTILGEPEGTGLSDFRTDADLIDLGDFAFLPTGDLLVADVLQNRIFRVGLDGILRPYAGTGSGTTSGDGDLASVAGIPRPSLLTTDLAGNVYVAQSFAAHSVIRRIDRDGILQTLAGNGESGCPSVGANARNAALSRVSAMAAAPDGTLYFALSGCSRIYRLPASGIVGLAGMQPGATPSPVPPGGLLGVAAADLQISSVDTITVDIYGNVVVSSRVNPGVLRITPDGVAVVVSSPAASTVRQGALNLVSFARPLALAAMPNGALAIAQTDPFTPGRAELGISTQSDVYSILFAQDAVAGKPAPFFQGFRVNPDRVRISPSGGIYIRDSFSQSIFEVRENGSLALHFRAYRRADRLITEGTNPTLRTTSITNLATDPQGNIYFGDPGLQRIYRLAPSGLLTRIAGNGSSTASGDGAAALDAGLALAQQIAVDAQGRVCFQASSTEGTRIRCFSPEGTVTTLLGGGDEIAPADGAAATSLRVGGFFGWTLAPTGELYFTQRTNQRQFIYRVGLDGKIARVVGNLAGAGAPESYEATPALDAVLPGPPAQMAVDPAGTFYFQPANSAAVYRIDAQGILRAVTAPGGAAVAVVDGSSTALAPPPSPSIGGNIFLAPAAGKLLLSAGSPPVLAEYTVGGTVRVLRSAESGSPRRDGGRLQDDRWLLNRSLATLPDGGLVWSEWNTNLVTLRRSFPVPPVCVYDVNATEIPVSGNSTLNQVTITTGADCPWTLGSNASWLRILTPRTGKGSTTVQFTAFSNPSPASRSATLRFAGREVTVNQGPSIRTDIFLVSPSAVAVPPTGGTVPISIVASAQQSWQVSLPIEPVTLTGPAAGSGAEVLFITVPALPPGITSRTLIVRVNDRPVAISQAAQLAPVRFTISSTLPGAIAVVDLVPRALPYEALWATGSSHLVRVSPFAAVNPGTVIQFQGWPDGGKEAERVLIAPAGAAGIVLPFRRLHRLSTVTSLGSQPNAPWLVPAYPGELVPASIAGEPPTDGTRYHWFPEGDTIEVFAPNSPGASFLNFSGAIPTSTNPVAIPMSQAQQVIANFSTSTPLRQDLLVGGAALWNFPGAERRANPAQLTVAPREGAPPLPTVFVAYLQPGTPGGWLSLRKSGDAPPYTLEAALQPDQAAALRNGDARVYFFLPGAETVSARAEFRQSDATTGSSPRITAVTDAGGFRQSLQAAEEADLVLTAAPGMILTLFGENLSDGSASATTVPLPTSLAGTVVEAASFSHPDWAPVPLFFVSPGQINLQVPPEFAVAEDAGAVLRLRVRRGAVLSTNETRSALRRRSVSLFTADSSGTGAPAGFFVRVRAGGQQERGNLFTCAGGQCAAAPAPLGGSGDELFLELYGTGFRNPGTGTSMLAFLGGKQAEISFAGPHPQFVGLDQVNVKVPRDTPRGQVLDLYVWVRNHDGPWMASNRLSVRFE